MKPPEITVYLDDENENSLFSTMFARDGVIYASGYVLQPEHARDIANMLKMLADAAEKQREYEDGQAQPE